jgi:hypothetical protein
MQSKTAVFDRKNCPRDKKMVGGKGKNEEWRRGAGMGLPYRPTANPKENRSPKPMAHAASSAS